MMSDSINIEVRKKAAINAIRRAYEAELDDHDVGLFVSHHLEEIGSEYWQEHIKTPQPTPIEVLNILVLRSHWGGESEDSTFDFTLPGEVTDYVISVSFDNDGIVEDIVMES